MKCTDKLLTQCCFVYCQEFKGKDHDFSECMACRICPVLRLYHKYKHYHDEVVWGPSKTIGDKQEMGCW